MKKTVLLLAAATLFFTGCKKRFPCIVAQTDTKEESRTVSNFSKVDLKIAADVYVTQDTTITDDIVTVVASENVLEHIETDVDGITLKIESKRCIRGKGNISVYITTNNLLGLAISGSGDIYVQNPVVTSSMDLDISGSGNIDINVSAQDVNVDISGSGGVDVSGTTSDLDIDITGSGDVDAYGLAAEKADINISGSGSTKVTVSELLDVKISGSGDVYYIGHPQIYQSITGSGNIYNKN